jgi:hypothetical protein
MGETEGEESLASRPRDEYDRRSSLSSRNHNGSSIASCSRRTMPWHRDPFHRVAIVLGGDVLLIECRDGEESRRAKISPGLVDWEEPTERIHRAVNVGKKPYEQVTVFLLDRPDAVAQPTEEQVSSLNNPRGAI